MTMAVDDPLLNQLVLLKSPHIPARLLLVDDNELILSTLGAVLRMNGFIVVCAGSVNEALKLISTESFDVLLSDLHMPQAGDGLTVVSAMRHANPAAVTLIFSGYPEMKGAADAIRQQADEVLPKPINPDALVASIRSRLAQKRPTGIKLENLADILEAETQKTIDDWLNLVKAEPAITRDDLTDAQRCAHLPPLFAELISRLRRPLPLGSKALLSPAAALHGKLRREQGYSAAMMVEESRMLQVSIFQTLQNNLFKVDFSLLLLGVMAIADEVDSQLAQAMTAYVKEAGIDRFPDAGKYSAA